MREAPDEPTSDAPHRQPHPDDPASWADLVERLTAADREDGLAPDALERLATAAYLTGRDEESAAAWARAHHAHLGRGEEG